MSKRIMVEASGSLVSSWMIKNIQKAGYVAVATDILEECYGRYQADDYALVPKKNDPDWLDKTIDVLKHKKVDIVIPSLDDTLEKWSVHKKEIESLTGAFVLLSEQKTLEVFLDKYKTYQYFKDNHIPTPKTSLSDIYDLIKPIRGRGSQGIYLKDKHVENMEGYISQTLARGTEYTVDCLVGADGKPIYIIPRKRLRTQNGKSIDGIVDMKQDIIDLCDKIIQGTKFLGPINIQCFKDNEVIEFIEVNPRIGGGMSLGMAASENWLPIMVEHVAKDHLYTEVKTVKDGLRMFRSYDEIYI